jgi:hypothetical protein
MRTCNPVLFRAAIFFAALTFVLCIGALFHTTEVLGLNALIKPIKFASSISIYFFTLAYLLQFWTDQVSVRKFSRLVVCAMAFEQWAITFQALRGQQSHFHTATVVGGILYALMGIAIVTATVATAWMCWKFYRQTQFSICEPKVVSIKLGMVMFIAFSFFGGYMVGLNSHNIGTPMGGAGLPFVNWSTAAGDLRVAHFLGLHSLQVVPLLGLWVCRQRFSSQRATMVVYVGALVYLAIIVTTMVQAISGKPLFGIAAVS